MKATLIALLFLGTTSTWAASWSGSYVGGWDGVSLYLQLVESPGGTLVGRFRQVTLDEKNKLKTFDAPFLGAGSGDQFVGKLEASWDRGGNIAFSGRRVLADIQVTASSGLRATLRIGTEEQEARAIEALKQSGQQTASAKAYQEIKVERQEIWRKRTEALDRLLSSTTGYIDQRSLSYGDYAGYPARYESVSAQLEQLLDQIKATTGSTADAISQRSTLSASMLHNKIDGTEHPQIKVKQAYDTSIKEQQELNKLLAAATKACLEPTPPDIDTAAFKKNCMRVPQLTESLRTAGENSNAEFYKIRDVYQRELSKQERLRAEAERLKQALDRR